jgi:phospholipid/cholesterol/gamma-HCH transport system ATP-binding protein
MQKRVGLARAIAAEPEIIFFDEPTTGLDPDHGGRHQRPDRRLRQRPGRDAISITHDMASRPQDRRPHRHALHEGKIIWQGPVADIDRSGNAYVDQFIHGRAEGPIKMSLDDISENGV